MFIVTFSNYLVIWYLPVLVGGVPESHIVSTCISGAGFQRAISYLPVLVGGVPESHIVSTCISGAGFQRVISYLPVLVGRGSREPYRIYLY